MAFPPTLTLKDYFPYKSTYSSFMKRIYKKNPYKLELCFEKKKKKGQQNKYNQIASGWWKHFVFKKQLLILNYFFYSVEIN